MTRPAERYACIYAKEFPAQALLRLRPEIRDQPCVVIEGEPPFQQVCSLNSKARLLGVIHGATTVELDTFALAAVLMRSRPEEAAAKAALLECAETFSPRVEDRSNDKTFLCLIDIAGTEKLFGPPQILAKTLLDRVRALRVSACVAVSSNFHAAICLARGMPAKNQIIVIPPGEERTALASLPIAVLDLSEEHAETFYQWGIRTFNMLAALPENDLIARLGQEGKRLHQLARGELQHLFAPVEPAFKLQEHMELDSPVKLLDSLLFVVRLMLEQLIQRATVRVLALSSVTITLFLAGGASHTRTVKPTLPTNDRQLWIKLLHLDLETHPPHAAILSLTLTAEPGSANKIQLGLFSSQLPEPMRLDVTLARIQAIVGEDCAGRAVLKDTHQPDAFSIEPFTVPSGPPFASSIDRSIGGMRQLRPPERVTVTLCGPQPLMFCFREKQYNVEHAYGPWLIGGNWWSAALWGLEQWDLIARSHDGVLLCCCLVRNLTENVWQMGALYD